MLIIAFIESFKGVAESAIITAFEHAVSPAIRSCVGFFLKADLSLRIHAPMIALFIVALLESKGLRVVFINC